MKYVKYVGMGGLSARTFTNFFSLQSFLKIFAYFPMIDHLPSPNMATYYNKQNKKLTNNYCFRITFTGPFTIE